jgi:hypothetical protein
MTAPIDDPEHRAAVERFRSVDTEQQVADASAIDLLQRRVRGATQEIDLGHGDCIRVRVRLARSEAQQVSDAYAGIAAIMQDCRREVANDNGAVTYEKIRDMTDDEAAAVVRYSNRLFAHILYDPARTPDDVYVWLCEHPDAFSDADQETIFLAYRWISEDEQEQRERLKRFRPGAERS